MDIEKKIAEGFKKRAKSFDLECLKTRRDAAQQEYTRAITGADQQKERQALYRLHETGEELQGLAKRLEEQVRREVLKKVDRELGRINNTWNAERIRVWSGLKIKVNPENLI